ncbi:MAG: T9SS type A sorting domain-containing protein [Saprospiraceae bacterium]|nr:T9SS type A sorting domain-containing protein [Saprospiraceae bacterium]
MLHAQESKAEIIWAERLFDRSKGLTEEHVYQVFEDRRGYFWITTDTDLLFFDGSKFFKVMNHYSPETFTHIRVRCQDSEGRIWVRYFQDGQYIFRVFNEFDRSILSDTNLYPPGLPKEAIRDVTVNVRGDFFFLTHDGDLWWRSPGGQNWQREETCISENLSFAFPNHEEGIWLISNAVPEDAKRTMSYWTPGDLRFYDIVDLIHVKKTEDAKLVFLTKKELGTLDTNGTRVTLPQAGSASLTIRDVTGKVLRVIRDVYPRGYNEVVLYSDELPATGVLYYTLETDNYVATKKMIITR